MAEKIMNSSWLSIREVNQIYIEALMSCFRRCEALGYHTGFALERLNAISVRLKTEIRLREKLGTFYDLNLSDLEESINHKLIEEWSANLEFFKSLNDPILNKLIENNYRELEG